MDKEKMKKLILKDDIKWIVGGVIAVVVIIVAVVLCIFAFGTNESKLKKELEDIGRNFYESYYYDSMARNYTDDDEGFKKFMDKYKEQGFTADLENLCRVVDNEKLKDFVNSKTDEECNRTNTKVTIIPKENYGKKDYDIKVTLDCGFDKKESKKEK